MLAALRQARPSCHDGDDGLHVVFQFLVHQRHVGFGKSVRWTDSFAPGMLLTTRFWYMFSVMKGM